MLSAVLGMAGGITLLAVLLLYLDPIVAIPLHGAVQLVGNASRTWIHRPHIDWTIVWRYALPLLPMGFIGLWLLQSLPPVGTKAMIGVFVFLATWRPSWLLFGMHPERIPRGRRFFALGAVVGVLNTTIGATGPLVAPFFLNLGFTRFGVIGTMGATQTLGHLAKISVFGFAGFAFRDYAELLAMLIALVVAGTWLGSQLLERVSERVFERLYKTLLTLIALRLAVSPWL